MRALEFSGQQYGVCAKDSREARFRAFNKFCFRDYNLITVFACLRKSFERLMQDVDIFQQSTSFNER